MHIFNKSKVTSTKISEISDWQGFALKDLALPTNQQSYYVQLHCQQLPPICSIYPCKCHKLTLRFLSPEHHGNYNGYYTWLQVFFISNFNSTIHNTAQKIKGRTVNHARPGYVGLLQNKTIIACSS